MQGELDDYYINNPGMSLYETKQASSANYYYSNRAFPTTTTRVLTVNYYDDYTFDKAGLILPSEALDEPIVTGSHIKGLATGSKVRVLGTDSWITSIMGYDKKGQVIYGAAISTIILKQTIPYKGLY